MSIQNETRSPIEYVGLVDIRFSDIDSYGHVNSKHYLDIISTARLNFLAEQMKMPIEDVTKQGIGFFLTKSTMNFKRPISGLQKVLATSRVTEVRDGKVLVIPYELTDETKTVTYSDGTLEFAIIDMHSKRVTTAPTWVLDLFFSQN
ncbi:acyl-CoA thioesterase [Bdellovibrio sp. HCB337]|uniref:acyl-CoA thioesterase n=1 Tax=Bdellovibrio sp. HCB337 TaxID=3394358 RepID=UPI0039A52C83